MGAEKVAVCLPFLLEAGYSARSAADRKALMSRLSSCPHRDRRRVAARRNTVYRRQ
jgi:hypothetical protein